MYQLVWSDVWLLMAILMGNANEGVSLKSIIANGDGINHAIFTHAELESGFCRLTNSNLILEKDGLFFPTSKANEIFKKVNDENKTMKDAWDILESTLNSKPYTPKKVEVGDCKYDGYSISDVDKAIEEYKKEFELEMEKYRNGN